MADKLTLEIVTPERLLLSESADEVIVPGLDGELGILPQHAALISRLSTAGILSYRNGDRSAKFAVMGGFVEVVDNRVSVLADIAERPEEIDVPRAKAALEAAERHMSAADRDVTINVEEAKAAVQREQVRIELAESRS